MDLEVVSHRNDRIIDFFNPAKESQSSCITEIGLKRAKESALKFWLLPDRIWSFGNKMIKSMQGTFPLPQLRMNCQCLTNGVELNEFANGSFP